MAGETWANVCPNIVEGQYAIGAGASAVGGCSDSNFPAGAHTKSTSASCSGSANGLNCATNYQITATCTYTWKMDYTSNQDKCGTTQVTQQETAQNEAECGTENCNPHDCNCNTPTTMTDCVYAPCSDDCPSGYSYMGIAGSDAYHNTYWWNCGWSGVECKCAGATT